MACVDAVWKRIKRNAGGKFAKIRGGTFYYECYDNYLLIIVNEDGKEYTRNIPKSHFERALAAVPLPSTACIQNLQGPSHIYAILMDDRIRHVEW